MLEKQAHADAFFARSANKLDFGNWDEKEKVALSCRVLASEGHSETLAGQITVRQDDGTFLTTPWPTRSTRSSRPRSSASTRTWKCWTDPARPTPPCAFISGCTGSADVQCIIHTHPPHVSTLSMTGQPLVVAHMDATPFHNDCAHLKEWPGLPIADQEGEIISAALGDKRSILLANHGFLAAGSCIEEALYLSVLIERAARNQLLAAAAYGR